MFPKSTKLRAQFAELVSFLWGNKFRIGAAAIGLLLFALFSNILIPITVIFVLAVAASYSTSYKRVLRVPPALELVTFTTVIVSLAYGPVVGAIYGAIVTFTAEIMTNALDIFIFSFVPARAAIGYIAGFLFALFDQNILITGVVASIIYNFLAQPMYILVADAAMRIKSISFILFNISFNFIIFMLFGNIMVWLLGIR
jgi:hypothetical protein